MPAIAANLQRKKWVCGLSEAKAIADEATVEKATRAREAKETKPTFLVAE